MAQNQLRKSNGPKSCLHKQTGTQMQTNKHEPFKLQLPLLSQVYGAGSMMANTTNGPNAGRDKKLAKKGTHSLPAKSNKSRRVGKAPATQRGSNSKVTMQTVQPQAQQREHEREHEHEREREKKRQLQLQSQLLKLVQQQQTAAARQLPYQPPSIKTDVRCHIEQAQLMHSVITEEAHPLPKDTHAPNKAAEKIAKAEGHRHARTKTRPNSTKNYLDKYLKGAFDLTTPEGVRQLEAHFFPNELHVHAKGDSKQRASEINMTRLYPRMDKPETPRGAGAMKQQLPAGFSNVH